MLIPHLPHLTPSLAQQLSTHSADEGRTALGLSVDF